jgi:hypothetical protein
MLAQTGKDTYARTFRKHEYQCTEDDRWYDLDCQGNPPLSSICLDADICAVRNPTSDESTNSEHELLKCGDCPSDTRMSYLSLVKGNNHNQETDTETCKPAASHKIAEVLSAGLESATNEVDDASHYDCPSSSKFISTWTC